jgi:hypothetical protein
MTKLLKFGLPIIIIGGLTYTATGGNPKAALNKQVGNVKRMVTKLELGRYVDRILVDYDSTGEMPSIEDPGEFRNWIGTNFKNRGTRPPGYDYWDNPYELVVVEEGHIILLSRGPNGIPDNGCADSLESGVQDLLMDSAMASDSSGEIDPEIADQVNPDDDVCVELVFTK